MLFGRDAPILLCDIGLIKQKETWSETNFEVFLKLLIYQISINEAQLKLTLGLDQRAFEPLLDFR